MLATPQRLVGSRGTALAASACRRGAWQHVLKRARVACCAQASSVPAEGEADAPSSSQPVGQAPAPPVGDKPPSEGRYKGWTEKEAWAEDGKDLLYQLGQQSTNMRIDMGARAGMIDPLFTGKFLGLQSDIASGELRQEALRSFSNLVGDYAIPQRFVDAVALHIVKNCLAGKKVIPDVPLMLGIWGGKGCGKSFNVELVCKLMGVVPIIVSAGELEDEYAGEPGRRIRSRYRAASQHIRNSGVMSCLIINDLDAGCGRFARVQMTVNNQMVMGTLMNLCDHPERASLGESWRDDLTLARVPIIVTGNDLSTLYAPLLRDGRMEKFLWQPTRDEVATMLTALYADDGLSTHDVLALVDAFPSQTLDFFGALRARRHDARIRAWAAEHGEDEVARRLRLFIRDEDAGAPLLPDFAAASVATLRELIATGEDLQREQQAVMDFRLSEEYMKSMKEVANGVSLGFG